MERNAKFKRALAAMLAVGTLAAALPATSSADGGTSPPPSGQSGGGSGP